MSSFEKPGLQIAYPSSCCCEDDQKSNHGDDGVAPVRPKRAFWFHSIKPTPVEQARVDPVADDEIARPGTLY